ncbi:MAG: calcium/sodium antiporter [Pseudomonadales bacterium]
MLLLYSVLLLVGFLVLFKSADQFVIGSVATAKNLNISPMVIGLTIVALGTSAPEIFVAAASSLRGEPELAVGNAVGSNIANMGMVMGITALMVPLPFKRDVLRHDLPIMTLVTICAGFVLFDNDIDIWDGLLLLGALALFLVRIAFDSKLSDPEAILEIAELDEIPTMGLGKALGLLILSLLFLLLSAELLVFAVIKISTAMGVSELFIGLTVIAVGTSLPELVVSVTSALKGETDLAIGNIVGSNIFNMLAVLSIPGFLAPTLLDEEILLRDYAVMAGMTIAVLIFAYGISRARVSRIEGGLLLLAWLSYMVWLYNTALG